MASSLGLRFRNQPYGPPLDMAKSAYLVDLVEGETLCFLSNPHDAFRILATGRDVAGKLILSDELAAAIGMVRETAGTRRGAELTTCYHRTTRRHGDGYLSRRTSTLLSALTRFVSSALPTLFIITHSALPHTDIDAWPSLPREPDLNLARLFLHAAEPSHSFFRRCLGTPSASMGV